MPLIKLHTNVAVPEAKKDQLLSEISKAVASVMSKPEQYVMVVAGHPEILMSGKSGPAAFVDIRSIGGLSAPINKKLSQKICEILNKALAIPGERVYINFFSLDPSYWGYAGATFG
jgi:phenylpyruvate tautomerase PptA (4-oxalocrotonate tautomerase family)